MDSDIPLKEGYLLFPPQGVIGHIKKAWHKKYCQLFRASKHGIERLEVFDNEEDVGNNVSLRIITLENCVKITTDAQKHQPNVFVVITKTAVYHLATVEETDLTAWLSALQSVAFKDDSVVASVEENDLYCSSGEGVFIVKLVKSEASTRCGLEPAMYTLLLTASAIQLRDTNNQAKLINWPFFYIRRYGYRDGKFTFEAGRKCETGEGEFGLEHSNPQEIYRCLSLKMKSMRKLLGNEVVSSPAIFSNDNTTQFQAALSMEARSRSPLPPSINSTTNMLELDFTNTPPVKPKSLSINNLLHAVPNKSKPLISPTVETNPLVVINAPLHLKPKRTISHGSLDTISTRKSPTLFRAKLVDIDIVGDAPAPPLKPKPSKPPRKNIFIQNQTNCEEVTSCSRRFYKQKSETNLQPSGNSIFYDSQMSLPDETGNVNVNNNNNNSYDEIEFRQEAWKTLGVNELHHTERPHSRDGSSLDYEVIEKAPDEPKNEKSPATKTKYLQLQKQTSTLGNYDTLQHFANSSTNKTKSGYRQIHVNSASAPTTPDKSINLIESYTNQQATFHDYDEVDEPMEQQQMTSFRSTDVDSRSGYGMIRRKSAQNDEIRPPNHKLYDEIEYAIVTKPKHV